MDEVPDEFPALLDIDYPDRELNRLTTFFRLFTVIPIAVILTLLGGPVVHSTSESYSFASGGILFLPTALMLLFRRKYPQWWFDWNLALVRFSTRVSAYLALLTDEYPSTESEQAVHIEVPYPDAEYELNRWLPLVKWLLAIPHYIVLAFLGIGVVFCVIVAWFVILFTGRYPPALFDFVVGVFRWWLRVSAYAFLLTTDRYPPFRLSD
jgi:hypothetical protein